MSTLSTPTWNVKLMATDEHPETAVEGLSQDAAAKLLRELMYGTGLRDREALREAALASRTAPGEGALAA